MMGGGNEKGREKLTLANGVSAFTAEGYLVVYGKTFLVLHQCRQLLKNYLIPRQRVGLGSVSACRADLPWPVTKKISAGRIALPGNSPFYSRGDERG